MILMRIFLAGEHDVNVNEERGATDMHAAHAAHVEIKLLRDVLHGIKFIKSFFEFMAVRY